MEEKTMRLGFAVPQFGPDAGPDALLEVARLAEDLGYDSLWVAERLLYQINPKAPYPGTADGSPPHGNELWEFDENGLMRRHDASINDYKIDESERKFRWEQ
jgi:hypothetical protein